MSESARGRGDIVVIGASAGGVQALQDVVASLPPDLVAALFVVVHTAPHGVGYLARILDGAGPLPAAFAEDGEPVRPGRIYVAPPDRHLFVRPGHVHLSRAPRENRTRPAVNPLFRTAAASYGPRVVGVVLTGMLDNGTAGLLAVERAGGTTVVQDPDEALYPGMPRSALQYMDPHHVVPLGAVAPLLVRLAARPAAAPESPVPSGAVADLSGASADPSGAGKAELSLMLEPRSATPFNPHDPRDENEASGFTCPDCSGALWELEENGLTEYICRTGHLFSPETLLDQQSLRRDDLLETALRAVREEAALARALAERGASRGVRTHYLRRNERRADELGRLGDDLERLLRDVSPDEGAA